MLIFRDRLAISISKLAEAALKVGVVGVVVVGFSFFLFSVCGRRGASGLRSTLGASVLDASIFPVTGAAVLTPSFFHFFSNSVSIHSRSDCPTFRSYPSLLPRHCSIQYPATGPVDLSFYFVITVCYLRYW